MADVLADLRRDLGEKAVRTDAYALEAYGVDRTTQWRPAPRAILLPADTGQVQTAVRLANAHRTALVPSGGRTGLSGGAVAACGELVLSMERMNRILRFSEADRHVEVEAGVITRQLQDFARDQGLFYPVDFASAGSSQIGGNIATNAGGIKVIRYGMTRNWVRGLSVVTGAGELLQCNGGLLKNNTGYDFRHLMAGSEGTLAVICEATMGLTRPPANPLVLVLGVRDFAALIPVLKRYSRSFELSAFECFSDNGLARVVEDQGLSRPFEQSAPYYALIELEEGPGVVEQALSAFEDLLAEGVVNDGVISQSLGEARQLWRLREDLSETLSRFKPYKNDISVPVSALRDFITEADALVADRYPDFELVWYGHIGDGNLHLNILKPDELAAEDFLHRCGAVTEEISALVRSFGGSISAEHGVGLLKKPYLHYSRSEVDIQLMRQLKRVFDPRGVLNPGKVFDA